MSLQKVCREASTLHQELFEASKWARANAAGGDPAASSGPPRVTPQLLERPTEPKEHRGQQDEGIPRWKLEEMLRPFVHTEQTSSMGSQSSRSMVCRTDYGRTGSGSGLTIILSSRDSLITFEESLSRPSATSSRPSGGGEETIQVNTTQRQKAQQTCHKLHSTVSR
jgi:hypothetical protein